MRSLPLSSLKHYGILQGLFRHPGTVDNFRQFSSASSKHVNKFWLLTYEYNAENIVERRGPFRPQHLDLVQEYASQGKVVLGGAFANPIDGAVVIFKGAREEVEEFIKKDPYVTNGIVTKHWIREWTVVAGAWMSNV